MVFHRLPGSRTTSSAGTALASRRNAAALAGFSGRTGIGTRGVPAGERIDESCVALDRMPGRNFEAPAGSRAGPPVRADRAKPITGPPLAAAAKIALRVSPWKSMTRS